MSEQYCHFCNEPAVAEEYVEEEGGQCLLCLAHLDHWMDLGDVPDSIEPQSCPA